MFTERAFHLAVRVKMNQHILHAVKMSNPNIVTIFLLALSSHLDNVGVGTSYGVRGINIPFGSNMLIAVIIALEPLFRWP